MTETRPTKAQFFAMSVQERAVHLKPLTPLVVDEQGKESGQEPYPTMTGAAFRAHREAMGMNPKDMAVKLKLRGKNPKHIPAERVAMWENGNPNNLAHLQKVTTVPGPVALQVLALRG